MSLKSLFRLNSYLLPVTIISISLAGILVLQTATISGIYDQIAQQKSLLEAQRETDVTRAEQFDTLTKHFDCVVKLFSQTNRDKKIIVNVDKCKIKSTSTPQPAPTYQEPTTQPSEPPKQSTPKKQTQPKDNTQTPPAQPQENFFQRLLKLLKL